MPIQNLPQARTDANDICSALNVDGYIVYVTSSREPASVFAGSVALDILPRLTKQLKKLGKRNRLALFLHTYGGDISAPWPIVSLLREYCNQLTIVVINRALSAGTLISMAGDKIVMPPDSFLSPIDPQTQLVMNGQQENVGVEDVTSYIDFTKNVVGLSGGAGLEKAFESLTAQVSPTQIGSMYRTHALIRSLASKMLNTRKSRLDTAQEKQIIESLTEKLFSHTHLISRIEAKEQVGLGSTITFPSAEICNKIDQLFAHVSTILDLDKFFDPIKLLGENTKHEEEMRKVLLFTSTDAATYKSKLTIAKMPDGKGAININDLGWEEE